VPLADICSAANSISINHLVRRYFRVEGLIVRNAGPLQLLLHDWFIRSTLMETALKIIEETGDETSGYLIERALDQMRADTWPAAIDDAPAVH
jgi:hypothetical protein